MPGSFSYNPGTNTVTATGGTSGSPATFGDFVTADRAGTLNCQDARNITGADSSPVAVTRAIRPVERLVLGGPAHTLYLVVTNWNATSATIRMVGTDYDGNAQQEDIALSGNGTLYTVNRYKTITSTQVTALSGTGFTYTLTQAGWGVIWNKGNGQYQLDCYFNIGDGSTSTYFKDINKQIIVSDLGNSTTYILVKANAAFYTAQLDSLANRVSSNACSILFLRLVGTNYYCGITFNNGASGLIAGTFASLGCRLLIVNYDTSNNVNLLNLIGHHIEINHMDSGVISNVLITYGSRYTLQVILAAATVENIKAYYCARALCLFGDNVTINNPVVRNSTEYAIWVNSANTMNIINGDIDTWSLVYNAAGVVYRKYTFDLHLVDINGNNISGATVTLKDNGGNTVFSVSTGTDGKIAQQTVSRGYYDQAHGNTLQEYGPHTLTITKAGCQDYQDVITIDRKMDLEVALLAAVAGGGAGVSPTNLGLVPLGIKQVAV
jgi:hypothetical protein